MRVRKTLPIVIASTIWVGQAVAVLADAPVPQARKPLVAAAKPRIAQAASTPAAPASAVSTAQVGAALPAGMAAPPMTLWRFLGVPQGLSRIGGATLNRRGNLPGLEPKPPLKALADPANLLADNKAIKTAAQIKKEEDLAKQKIKAIKYLAKIGCGCYPGVKEALMEALEDCTEKVRYEAAKQIGKAAENKCETCSKNCCCDAEMMQALWDVANKRDANNCFVEPSERVREAACEALLACRRAVPVYGAPAGGIQREGGETIPDGGPRGETIPDANPPLPPNETRSQQQTDALLSEIFGIPSVKGRTTNGGKQGKVSSHVRLATPVSTTNKKSATDSVVSFPQASPEIESKPGMLLTGKVVAVDYKTSTVDLEFEGKRQPTVGSRFSLHHDYALETLHLGEVEVVYLAKQGRAIARPLGKMDMLKVGKGDKVSGRTAGSPAPAESVAAAPKASPVRSMTMRSTTAAPPAPSKTIVRRATTTGSPRAVGLHAATLAPAKPAKVNSAAEDLHQSAVKRAPEIAVELAPAPSVPNVEVADSQESRVDASAEVKSAVIVRLVQPRTEKGGSAVKPSLSTPKPQGKAVEPRHATASAANDATKITFVVPSASDKPEADAAPASWVTIED